MPISKHFNQNSNKILAIDEFANRETVSDSAEDRNFTREFLSDFAEWQDAGGRQYISALAIQTMFSNLAAAALKNPATAAKTDVVLMKIQKAIDESEDHSDRLKAGRLTPKPAS